MKYFFNGMVLDKTVYQTDGLKPWKGVVFDKDFFSFYEGKK